MQIDQPKPPEQDETPTIYLPNEHEIDAFTPRWEDMNRRVTNGARLLREWRGDGETIDTQTVFDYRSHPTLVSFLLVDTPGGSCCQFSPERTSIIVSKPQALRAATELDLDPRHVEGAILHHEFGHLDYFLRGFEPGKIWDWEVAAWELARSEIHRHLPTSWGSVPEGVYAAVSTWALTSYERI